MTRSIDQAIAGLTIGAVRDLRVALSIAAASAQDTDARVFLRELLSIMETRAAQMPGYDRTEIQRIYSAAQTSISFIDHIMASVRSMEDEEPEQDPYTIN